MIQFIAILWMSFFSLGIQAPQDVNDNAEIEKVTDLGKDDGNGNSQGGGGGK